MNDAAVEALRRLVDSTEGGRFAIADAIHANEQTIYQILAGVPLKSGKARTVGRDLRERLDRTYPGWLHAAPQSPTPDTQPPKGVRPPERLRTGGVVAHGMSFTPIDHLPTIKLEEDMNWNELPAEFEAAMPDDALAPDYPRGLVFGWSTAKAPQAGSVVLVRDAHGRPHVREYRRGIEPGQWQAAAINRAYPSFTHADARIMAAARFREMP